MLSSSQHKEQLFEVGMQQPQQRMPLGIEKEEEFEGEELEVGAIVE